MRVVGIKNLKNKLSEYVKLAANGERILVTDRDRVVAELVPPASVPSPYPDNPRMAELVRRGVITPARVVGAGAPPRDARVPRVPFEQLMRDLDEDRADR